MHSINEKRRSIRTARYFHLRMGVVAFTLLASGAHADILFISPGGGNTDCSQTNPCSLDTAKNAPAGSTIYLAAGKYTGTDVSPVFSVAEDLTLMGGWDGTTITPVVVDSESHIAIIDGEQSRRCLAIAPDATVLLEGITITNGFVTTTTPNETIYGAGLYSSQAKQVTLRKVKFVSNHAHTESSVDGSYAFGGGAYLEGGSFTAENCTFTGNVAWAQVDGSGAALAIEETTSATVTECLFENNDAWSASGIYFAAGSIPDSPLDVKKSIFLHNGVGNSSLAIGGYSGAIEAIRGDVTVDGNTFQENNAVNKYGAVRTVSSTLRFTNNRLFNNTSRHISALSLRSVQSFTIVNNIITGNTSTVVNTPTVLLDNSSGSFQHNTMAGNETTYAIQVNNSSSVTLTNNIISEENIGVYVEPLSSGLLNGTLWYANTTDYTGGGDIDPGTVNIHGAPGFKDPSAFDFHLTFSSAARNNGIPSTVTRDFEGDSRPMANKWDIGADEFREEGKNSFWHMIMPAIHGKKTD